MHAYLIVGNNQEAVKKEIEKIISIKKAELLPYQINKIGEVRQLEKLTRLKLTKPTAILIEKINASSDAAFNAFLKNLEEPQASLTYILTADTIYSIPPTIVSRCQVIKLKDEIILNEKLKEKYLAFFNMETGKKLQIINNIKTREEALIFVKELTLVYRHLLYSNKADKMLLGRSLKAANSTYKALRDNANVKLQLVNFLINL